LTPFPQRVKNAAFLSSEEVSILAILLLQWLISACQPLGMLVNGFPPKELLSLHAPDWDTAAGLNLSTVDEYGSVHLARPIPFLNKLPSCVCDQDQHRKRIRRSCNDSQQIAVLPGE
jgi:hypothetical protein